MRACSRLVSAGAGALLFGATACGGESAATTATGAQPGAPGAAGASGAAGGAPGARSLVLAVGDVATVATGTIEDGVAITGTLNPGQTIAVRARIEGDIDGVYVREGESVRAGQVLARFEASQQVSGQQSAVAERVAAQGELSTAQWNLDQTRELYRAGAVAERDLRAAEQSVATARARLAAARARERTTSVDVGGTRIEAPTSAVVSRRLVEPGEHVSRGTELFTLVKNDVLELAAAVPERRAGAIAPGQPVRFDAAGQRFEGRVARINPTIDPATRSVSVYVQVPNPRRTIRGGTFATGTIVSRVVNGAVLVPIAAVRQSTGGAQFVYRIAGSEVEQVPVSVGLVNDAAGIAEARSGLSPGDRVIVGNVGTVGRGMRVQVIGGDTVAGTSR